MVNLSLRHRVQMDKAASSYNDAGSSGPRRILLGLSTATAVCNVIFLIAGAVIATIIDEGAYSGEPNQPWEKLHKEGTIVVQRVQLVFFWCTIPFILSVLSIVEVILQRRGKGSLRLILAMSVATVGLLFWLLQFGLESNCMLAGGRFRGIRAEAGYCGFELRQWDPRSFWQSGLALAWYLSWCAIVMLALYIAKFAFSTILLLRQRKAANKRSKMQQDYSYHSPIGERESHTDRDMPDRSAANTPVPLEQQRLTGHSRPPSQRAESMFHEESPLTHEEKEREMV